MEKRVFVHPIEILILQSNTGLIKITRFVSKYAPDAIISSGNKMRMKLQKKGSCMCSFLEFVEMYLT